MLRVEKQIQLTKGFKTKQRVIKEWEPNLTDKKIYWRVSLL
jgi:hypothetical protein